ncbi:MAG: putative Ig domain-containing protein [Terriglobales bacterium]
MLRHKSQLGHGALGLAAAALLTAGLSGCGSSPAPAVVVPPVTANFLMESSTGGTLPEGVVDTPYAYGFQTNVGQPGVDATAPVVFQAASALPPGLTLSDGGVLSGSPTQPGVFSVAIEAVDSSSPMPLVAAFTYLMDVRLPGVTLTQVAHSDLGGRGQNGAVRVVTSSASGLAYAYVGTLGTPGECPATGIKIVSLSTVTNPQVVATAGGVSGASQANVRVGTGLTSPYFHNGGRGDIMAVTEQPCNPANGAANQEGVQFYDVTNPASPQFLGSWSSGLDGGDDVAFVEVPGAANSVGQVNQSQDKIYALVGVPGSETSPAGNGEGDLRVLDITNPATPEQIGDWGVLKATDELLPNVVMGYDPRVFLASINLSSDGKTAYLGYWDEGVVVLNVSDPTQIATNNPAIFLDHITYPITSIASTTVPAEPEGNTRAALPMDNDTDLLIADQVCASAMSPNPSDPSQQVATDPAVGLVCGPPVPLTLTSGWGFVRTYALGTPGTATLESYYADPQSMSAPAPDDGIYTAHALAWNGNTADPHAYVAWYSAGVEDLDITSIAPPTPLASFVPPDTPDPNGSNPLVNNPPKALVDGVAAYNANGNHYILASDINSGLWIVQETPTSQLTILTTILPNGNVGVPYSAALTSVNGSLGNSKVTYSLTATSEPMPSGLTLNSDGTITGVPLAAGTVAIDFQADDGAGTTTVQQIQMTIDQNLAITTCDGTCSSTSSAIAPQLGTIGEGYTYTLSGVNGTAPYTWSLANGSLPPGFSLDSTTGVISGTATSSGTYTATVEAADSSVPAEIATLPLTLQVAGLTPPSTPPPDPVVGTSYTATVTMSNGQGPFIPTLFNGTLPPGLSVSTSEESTLDWQFTGTPTQAGTYNFTILVTDADGQTADVPYSMTVEPFTITPAFLTTGVEGRGYLEQLSVSGGTSPYQFQMVLGQLPSGLNMDQEGDIYGVPASGTAGTDSFSIAVTDANGLRVIQPFTLTIFNPTQLAITTVQLPSGQAGQQYSQAITANFGTAPYVFSLTNGSLPPGVTLSPAGELAGVPAAASTGPYSFTVEVRDATGATAQGHFNWIIAPQG